MNYLGQGALLLRDPSLSAQPFYAMVPSGLASVPFVLLGTAATIIASQALISGVFSLTSQAIHLGYFPRLAVLHTSSDARGQIYMPTMNAFLAISSIALVLAFQESSKLAAAFGLAVSATMAVTSIVFYPVARIHFGWSKGAAVAAVAVFLVVDGAFLIANAFKFFSGGYIPFVTGVVFFGGMLIWIRGRRALANHFRRKAEAIDTFIAALAQRAPHRMAGVGVVMTANAVGIPPALQRLVDHFQSLPRTTILLTVTIADEPVIIDGPRFLHDVVDAGAGIVRVGLRFGYMEQQDVHGHIDAILQAVAPGTSRDDVKYILGHERAARGPGGEMGPMTESIYELMARNGGNPTDFFKLPSAQVIELVARIDL